MRGIRALLAIAVSSVSLLACQMTPAGPGIELKPRTRFEYELTRYEELAGFKSMAVAGDPTRTHVTGIAYAYPLQILANRAALSFCESRREDRDLEAPCRTYAIGDVIVAEQGAPLEEEIDQSPPTSVDSED